MGLSGAVCVAAALAVEFLVSRLLGLGAQDTIVVLLLGSIVAMLGSNALAGHEVWKNVRAAVFFPVALGTGMVTGIAVDWNQPLSLVAFVVVMFVAVYVRRFGLNFFFYGFMVWMGYFFAAFLHATFAQLPLMLFSVAIGTVVVLVLCITVFRPHPRRTLARIFRSTNARSRALGRSCAAVLRAGTEEPDRRRAARRLFSARTRVSETALMSDGWAAHARALPVGWTADALRRRLLDVQVSLDSLSAASDRLVRADRATRELAAAVVDSYVNGDNAAAHRQGAALVSSDRSGDPATSAAVRRLVRAVTELTALPQQPSVSHELRAHEDFTPAADMPLGNLPGVASVANDVTARGGRWNPLARLRPTTRQATQAALAGALAVVVGTAINDQRYYWAVIAAFVVFTGTGTRLETLRKSVNRVLGTMVGLLAGILLANLASGNVVLALAIIVASIFCGFYLVRVSYAYMIFFVTIMVSQLYGILGEFSDELLFLRLAETAAGVAIGVLVAALVAPISARDTVTFAERAVIGSIADLLETVAGHLTDPTETPSTELDARMLAVDNAMRRLTLAADPLTKYQMWESRPRTVRRRLTVVSACVRAARSIAVSSRSLTAELPMLSTAATNLAGLARDFAAGETDAAGGDVAASEPVQTQRALEPSSADVPVYRTLLRLEDLITELGIDERARRRAGVRA